MTRYHDWPERLGAFIQASRGKSFSWPERNCGLWAADAVQEITGEDFAAPFRGKCDSQLASTRAMRDFAGGLGDCMAKLAAASGMPEISVPFAQRGDVVLVWNPTEETQGLGIVSLDGRFCCGMSLSGLFHVRVLDHAQRAWRVG